MSENEKVVFVPGVDKTQKWAPVVGEFTENYLDDKENLDEQGKARVLDESAKILGNCTPPTVPVFNEAGIVIGFVQSGKTMSFTTIAALARDNGYGMVIVLTGVTNLLKSQSVERLVDDLGLVDYPKEWKIFENPGSKSVSANNPEVLEIGSKLEAWSRFNNGLGGKKPSVLVPILKRSSRIDNLRNVLTHLDLAGVPTLIIDDESDQATPNTRAAKNLKTGEDDESSTYASIAQLRQQIPRHTYLQYTATPQANLLAAKSDELSPAFARVISSGDDYRGSGHFFGADNSHIVEIPDEDTIKPKHLPEEPPESLLDALRWFWLGATITTLEGHKSGKRPATRSMMIQVSSMTLPQAEFRKWAVKIQTLWKKTLLDSSKAAHHELVEEFKSTYAEIKTSTGTHLDFDSILAELPDSIEDTKIVEVNSTDDAVKTVEWFHSQFWILVGGMKLDRGFTVRGITTTYMPRTPAENADTLQQRARFFGYHGGYFGLCRIYISKDVRTAFEKYLEHETGLRTSLEAHQGKPLSEWKREFILHRAIRRATRPGVIGLRIGKTKLNEGWMQPHYLHVDDVAIEKNRNLAFALKTALQSKGSAPNPDAWVDKRANTPKHVLYAAVDPNVVHNFLMEFAFVNANDNQKNMALLVAGITSSSKDPDFKYDVVLINDLETAHLEGREVDEEKGLSNVFVGRSPAGVAEKDLNYVGDRAIHTDRPTLHLRLVKIFTEDKFHFDFVPWVSLHLPKSMETDFLSELQDD
jgi:hypothetical protein